MLMIRDGNSGSGREGWGGDGRGCAADRLPTGMSAVERPMDGFKRVSCATSVIATCNGHWVKQT